MTYLLASDLWTALLSGEYDLAMANEMIRRGLNINEPRNIENYDPVTTLLHYAVATNDVQCVSMLTNFGANVNARDSKARTPLHWVAIHGAGPDILELLLNKGAFVDERDYYLRTPLHYHAISKKKSIETVQKLITRGASIDATGADSWSVLHLAITYRNMEMVRILISHSVNVDAKDNFGCTPLFHYFKMHREGEYNTEIIQLLLENGADVNSHSNDTKFPLFYAAKFNRLDSLHLLLTWGARVDEATNMGFTALHVTCENGLADATVLLLKFGADFHARSRRGKTPFEMLLNRPSTEAIAQIIIREAVKSEALGQSLYERYNQIAPFCENYSKFDQECREEITRMQTEKIDAEDSAISFFYIFSMDEEKLAALARNEEIVTAFESSGYVASFSIYADELTTKFKAAKKRANFLISNEDCLGDVLGDILPATLVQKIVANV